MTIFQRVLIILAVLFTTATAAYFHFLKQRYTFQVTKTRWTTEHIVSHKGHEERTEPCHQVPETAQILSRRETIIEVAEKEEYNCVITEAKPQVYGSKMNLIKAPEKKCEYRNRYVKRPQSYCTYRFDGDMDVRHEKNEGTDITKLSWPNTVLSEGEKIRFKRAFVDLQVENACTQIKGVCREYFESESEPKDFPEALNLRDAKNKTWKCYEDSADQAFVWNYNNKPLLSTHLLKTWEEMLTHFCF